MARPQKPGVDYFPLDTILDTKFELIEAEYGLTGFAIVVKLLQKIYREFGYYCEWTNEVALLFSKQINEGCSAVSEIVNASIRRGIFDKNLFDKYHILTSRGIQKRYLEAVNRRLQIDIISEYLLIPHAKILENVNINSINVNINSKNVYNNPQSKEKKIKLNNIKEKELDSSPSLPSVKHKYGKYENVLLSDDDLKKLKSEFSDWEIRIENLSEGIAVKGYKYKNHLAVIRKWARTDQKQKTVKPEKSSSFDTDDFFKQALKRSYGG